ncbi:DEAD-box ATP-dependent RNA helicase 14-like protein isoform X1 [Tanacetum coccineum]
MAADGTADALGVRYAPPDPTLPETWKGLIDGYTSVISYWNPETNVTQYERPTALVSLASLKANLTSLKADVVFK